MTAAADLRLFFVGGALAYRALFNWLSPWIFVPTLLIGPLFQMLLFTYIGRTAGVEDDAFFVVGNALQLATLPGLFAAGGTIGGERFSQTLPYLLGSPASRLPLFLGRSLPVIANGIFVSAFVLAAGALLLDFDPPASSLPGLAVVTAVTSFSCTGLGILIASAGFRVRSVTELQNVVYGGLLVLCGVNVPLSLLPGWLQALSQVLPLTHGIEAARDVAAGTPLSDVAGLVLTELAVGAAYLVAGLAALAWFERQSRRHASLERM